MGATRRTLFAGAAGLAAFTIPVATQAAALGGIAEMWAEAEALIGRLEAEVASLSDGEDDARLDAPYGRAFALEGAVLVGPIRGRADAIAKLKAVNLTFERGTRLDKMDHPALSDAIRWLEAHP